MLATSLAPIIGETVRKAVANAFRNMAESINFTLERSLSWESMKWRFEALRTGKSFGEIVLLRSLRYKVQQVVPYPARDRARVAVPHGARRRDQAKRNWCRAC